MRNSTQSYLLAGGPVRDTATPVSYKSKPVNSEILPPASQTLSLFLADTQLQKKHDTVTPNMCSGYTWTTNTPENFRTGHLLQHPLTNKEMINRKVDNIWQRSSFQTKEQGKNTQKPLNDEEIGNLPEKKFRVMIPKMIKDLGKIMETQIENLKRNV